MPRPLSAETLLDVNLSATCGRHAYDSDPAVLLAELRSIAGDRMDILARVAGTWSGFHEKNSNYQVAVVALAQIDGADAWIELGRERARGGGHTAPLVGG